MTTTNEADFGLSTSMEERVARLLKHAEDFRRHGEDGSADAALARAEEIMLKYSLDAMRIAARAVTADEREPIVTEWVAFTGIYRSALVVTFQRFVKAFSNVIRTFASREGATYRLALVGVRSDVLQLKALITSVHLQAIGKMNIWWGQLPARERHAGMLGFKTRRQYVTAFVEGATSRVEQARQVVQRSAEPGTALVLRDARAAVDAYVAANYSVRTTSSQLKPGTRRAQDDGYADGRQANTGDTPVTGDRRRLEAQ